MRLKLMLLIAITAFMFAGCKQGQQVVNQEPSLPIDNTEEIENVITTASTTEQTENAITTENTAEQIDEKMFAGKWKSENININGSDVIIFVVIELKNGITEPKIQFNFNTTAFYNLAISEARDTSLYFSHNDEDHKAEYIMTLKDNDLIQCEFSIKNCFGMTGVYEKTLQFTRLSSEDELKYKESGYTVAPLNLSKLDILKEYAEYGTDSYDIAFEYKFDERENMLDIIEENNLDELVDGKSDVETAIALMNWLCEKYKHGNPEGGLAKERTPQALMEFAEQNGGTTNCRGLSLILAQLIRAYNIEAFHITCMPYEDPFDDCHVVVSAYCESLGKWIMLDPSSNLYLKNEEGEIIGVEEFRDILIAGEPLYSNQNGTLNWYRDYMAKNLIRLSRGTVEQYGGDESGGSIILIPEKYMQNEAKNFNTSQQKNFMTSKDDFWKK